MSNLITAGINGWLPLQGAPIPGVRALIKGECRVLVGLEPHGRGNDLYWHLSISCEKRYPTWEEIKDARYSLMPHDIMVAQLLPPPSEFVNIHPNCFHLWEIDRC